MYTRYIPQPDGSYRRNHIPDPNVKPRPISPAPPPKPEPAPCPPPPPERRKQTPQRPQEPKHTPSQGQNVGSFLKQLLPKDFDTGDLFVVFLLLLMAGDCQEDQNIALLTLALYFFM